MFVVLSRILPVFSRIWLHWAVFWLRRGYFWLHRGWIWPHRSHDREIDGTTEQRDERSWHTSQAAPRRERESAGIQPDHHREERFSSATYLGELKPRVFAYSAVSGLPWGAKISCVPRIFELGPYGSVWADTCAESIPWALGCLWDASWTPKTIQNQISSFRGLGVQGVRARAAAVWAKPTGYDSAELHLPGQPGCWGSTQAQKPN